MRDCGLQNRVRFVSAVVRPIEEGRHLFPEEGSGRRLVMDLFFSDRTRNDLRRPVRVIAPHANHYLAHAAAAGWNSATPSDDERVHPYLRSTLNLHGWQQVQPRTTRMLGSWRL